MNNAPMPIVIVGHVDHGKSTLVGRLLYDTDSLPEGKMEEVEQACKRRGVPMEWSFLLDAFQAERDQAITIDTTQIWFSSDKRPYVIIDAPGHREFLKNMVSGAAQADAAILVVDAKEGLQEQTKRHAYLLSLLGLKQVAVVINKMDSIDYDENTFKTVSNAVNEYLQSIDIRATHTIPVSAKNGDMIATKNNVASWYKGKTLLEVLDTFKLSQPPISQPLRFPIQDVYRFEEKRVLVGRVETGELKVGDTVLFSPTNETARIKTIENWPETNALKSAHAGEATAITLDEPIFVERGHICSHEQNPPMLSNVFKSNIFWLSKKSLKIGNTYTIRFTTFETKVTVQSIDNMLDTSDLSQTQESDECPKNAVAEVTFRSQNLIPLDPHTHNVCMGRVVIYDEYDIAGGGLIHMDGYADRRHSAPKSENIHKVEHLISKDKRDQIKGHKGGIFWFTGLSGAGKSTLAMAVEQGLTERGYHSYVLDGDNVRHGLNADLGFSPEDRTENIRRIGEVAALMADAGLIVISAFISPYQTDRDKAREACPNQFNEIYVKADLKTCEDRDPKGLYKKARAGEIKQFTGIDAPYEPPVNPELVISTQFQDVQSCVGQVIHYIETKVMLEEKSSKEKSFSAAS